MNRGPFIRLRSGRQFHFLTPRLEEVEISDIAHSLAGLPRFNNHTRTPYYVLQHLCLCHDAVQPEYRKEALGHDYAEGLTGDISSPLKSLLPDFKDIERRVEKVIARKFGLRFPFPPAVKVVDLTLLATEMRDLMHNADWHGLPYKPLPERIVAWDSARCKREFYRRFRRLYS